MPKIITTEALVIGGGATGTGVARDLAMRGFKTALVEKRDFTHGTTGRYHGLLHSGGRYAVKDPLAARECIQENRILRRIMPHCIEDTGGFFVLTPWDDSNYTPQFLQGCLIAGIPVEEIPISLMLKEEPLLNPQISRCFRVPDGAADSFLGAHANVASAREYGASIFNYHQVTRLISENNRVRGAHCRDLIKNEDVIFHADIVINASGAWAGKITETIGIPVKILPGKGVMIAVNHRIVNTIVNRCHPPSDGDILVPAHTVAVIGTTDVRVDDPEDFAIEPWEIRLMLEEGEKLLPGFKRMRMLRAWAGVRPLYQEENNAASANRDVTRAFVLLDHEERDGIAGLVTITSGKWTTYRKMAEVTVDLVCQKLKSPRACRTHLEPLPDHQTKKYHSLGARLGLIEKSRSYGQLVCECELATYEDVKNAILSGAANTLDDIRRDVRLGMGPCQAGFCSLRAIGILHKLRQIPVEQANASLRDFLQERWKGVLPILWGQQLRQERLNELIYRSLLSADHLPGPAFTPLKPNLYAKPISYDLEAPEEPEPKKNVLPSEFPEVPSSQKNADLVIIGAGLAGLVAGWQAAKKGKRVHVIAKGWGALYWHTGCIDVFGYLPGADSEFVSHPANALVGFLDNHPEHPYSLAGMSKLEKALDQLKELGAQHNYPFSGDLESNYILPTSLGAPRPTCLAPSTMVDGDLRNKESILVVGFTGYLDFYPHLIAENLQRRAIPADAQMLNLASLSSKKFITSRVLAECFENQTFRSEVIRELKEHILPATEASIKRIGFPAVLGIRNSAEIQQELEDELGMVVFEIPTLPPSIPGMRLHQILVHEIENHGGCVYSGMEVIGASSRQNRINAVYSEAAARFKSHVADTYILATGGFLGGGIIQSQRYHPIETIFDLPVSYPKDHHPWFEDEFLSSRGQPLFQAGIRINSQFQPADEKGHILYENLYIAGNLIYQCDALLERSIEGVALVSGYITGNLL